MATAEDAFCDSVASARNAFNTSLRKHAPMDDASLDEVLDAFDASVSDITAALLVHVNHLIGGRR